MITAYHPVELNGVKYRLAESVEGRHYVRRKEPLRLQTGAVVQGESGKFQLRPDLLEWSITDWSGGEGLIKFSSEEANRYWEGHNIDPFDEIGKLKLARGWEETKDNLGAALTKSLQLTKGIGGLWGASIDSNGLYEWDSTNNRWKAAVTNGDAGFAAGKWEAKSITGDSQKLYIREDGVAAVWSYDGTSFAEHNTDVGSTSPNPLAELGAYVYHNRLAASAGLWEIPKTGTPPVTSTQLLDLSADGMLSDGLNYLAAGTNRLYLAQNLGDGAVIWRIVPSSAASAGFAEEILRQEGLVIHSLWFHMGVLFLAGRARSESGAEKQVIMYLRGSEVGVLANLRPDTTAAAQICSTQGQEFAIAYFLAKYGPGDATHEWTLFAVDLISGAVAGTTVIDLQDAANQPQTLVAFAGEKFFGTNGATSTYDRTIRVFGPTGNFVNTSTVTARLDTAVNDFGVVDQKILLSLRLVTEPLPANCSVEIQYQIDQDGVWTSAGTYSTTNGTGTTFTVSTAASAVRFRNLQLRLILSNGGTVASSPIVLSVSTRATTAAGLNRWRLLLDIADDDSSASRERKTGAQKMDNIITAADSETVVAFKDGYQDRQVGTFTTHNVVIDSYEFDVERPGEGTAAVELREVV